MKFNVSSLKIIAPVPPELKNQFEDLQLKNTIFRIKILALVGLFFQILNAVLVKPELSFEFAQLWKIRNYIELGMIAFSVLFYFPNIKKANKTFLWTICIVCLGIMYSVYTFALYVMPTANNVSPMVFNIGFLFTMLPDFKPKAFISLASLFLIAVISMLCYKYQFDDVFFSSASEYTTTVGNCIVFILIVLITKILLYNSKVRRYVNTDKINALNTELQHYNVNLEEMVDKKTATIVELKNAILETIANLVEHRDDTTGNHVLRTSRYLRIVMDLMLKEGLYRDQTESWDINQMVFSSQLHDVGKISIDDSILRKPGKLDADEYEKMKQHTIFGGEIIQEIQKKTSESDFLNYAYTFAVYHHEKWDGSGYPYGLTGEDIPLPARLMAIIDVYDALISERPYKKAFSHEESIKIIEDGKGTHFDPSLTEIFLSASEQFARVKK
ncbi:MAG: HD domain-containing protein [Treponema sp.]|nr:HD domain-containing protein [Treponema sp.]